MTRRELFALAAAAVLVACKAPGAALPLPPRPHLDAAREVGRAVLAEGETRDSTALSDALRAGFSGTEPRAFTAHLLTRHQADLAEGRTFPVQGWLLSRTEAALYAWLAASA